MSSYDTGSNMSRSYKGMHGEIKNTAGTQIIAHVLQHTR